MKSNENAPLTEEQFFQRLTEMFGEEFVKYFKAKDKLGADLEKANTYYQQLMALREYYIAREEEILATFQKSRFLWATSYPTDWSRLFTPIEQMAWQSIRCKGRIVLYPQYPIGKYQADFANPGFKIALELDGKDYHNTERDRKRDAELAEMGWTVFRVSGAEMYRTDYKEWYEMEEMVWDEVNEEELLDNIRHWIMETGDGVIQAIKETYFDPVRHATITPYLGQMYRQYCYDTLETHKLI
jgi:very-short-patch-repair endonuclease